MAADKPFNHGDSKARRGEEAGDAGQQEQTEVTERGLEPPTCCVSIGVPPSLNPVGALNPPPAPYAPPRGHPAISRENAPGARRCSLSSIVGGLGKWSPSSAPSAKSAVNSGLFGIAFGRRRSGMVRGGQPRLKQARLIHVDPWLPTRRANRNRPTTPRSGRPRTSVAPKRWRFSLGRGRPRPLHLPL